MRLPSPVHSPDGPTGEVVLSNIGVPGATPPAAPAAPSAPAAPAPAAPAAETPPASILSAPGSTPAPVDPAAPAAPAAPAVAATWPEDWRTKAAGGDPKAEALLGRYTDPAAFVKAHLALQQKMSSGELKPALPADATPEQTAEYRKLHGIPEEPTGYLKELPSGLIIGEADRVLYDDFAKHMHGINASPAVVKAAIEWQFKYAEGIAKADAERDGKYMREAEDVLRTAWGKEYRENVDRSGEVIGMAPASVHKSLEGARLADGTLFANNPDVAKWLAGISRELNPVRTLVPSGGMPGQGLDEEIKSIESKMGTPAYWKDDAMQSRYRDLIDARDRQKARAA